jgi:hypothetical protein
MQMRERIAGGLVAGTAGTVALNAATYLDMVARGRPESELPGQAAAKLAKRFGVDLQGDDDATKSRRTAVGALMGLTTGVAVATAYALVRGDRAGSTLVEGAVIGAAAMVAADAPLVGLGLTNPRAWGVSGWLSDAVPHFAYGAAVASVLRRW